MDKENMPKHIAIIMDGNRRWAREHNLDPKQALKDLKVMALKYAALGLAVAAFLAVLFVK